jgi:hypothetical protein
MNSSSLVRAWIGIGVASLLSLASSFAFFDEWTAKYREQPDPWAIARQQVRFAALRAELPAGTVLGYYSDVPPGKREGTVAFYAVLYSVAPHLLVRDEVRPQPGLVVGNFARRPDLARLELESGLALVKDYGRGVVLFRREKK